VQRTDENMLIGATNSNRTCRLEMSQPQALASNIMLYTALIHLQNTVQNARFTRSRV
jgi:hypothetical protein